MSSPCGVPQLKGNAARDYEGHVHQGRCTCNYSQPVPCVSLCPAHVDIPGYVALVREGRYADAIRLIRKDNLFPTTLRLSSVNIHARPAAEETSSMMPSQYPRFKAFRCRLCGQRFHRQPAASTGKKIAIIGGGREV